MHPLDMMLLFAIANVVAWPAAMYVDGDFPRVIGHLIVTTIGALIGGYMAQLSFPDSSKFILIFGGFGGAVPLLYLVRFKKWKKVL